MDGFGLVQTSLSFDFIGLKYDNSSMSLASLTSVH